MAWLGVTAKARGMASTTVKVRGMVRVAAKVGGMARVRAIVCGMVRAWKTYTARFKVLLKNHGKEIYTVAQCQGYNRQSVY